MKTSLPTTKTATLPPGRAVSGSDDIYHLYLREIGPIPLLSRDEELELARRAQRGDTTARERLIKAHLRLVVKIARDYEGFGVALIDLVAEGNIGLMKAVDRFDAERGAKLSVYASFWIKQSIRRAISSQSRTIRLPDYAHGRLLQLQRMAHQLRDRLGHEPTDEELAFAAGVPIRSISRLRLAAQHTVSLDEPCGQDTDATVAEVVPDAAARTPCEALDQFQMESLLRELMRELTPREAHILRCRFGLNGCETMTLEELAGQFNVTRERIRQLQNSGLAKMRRHLAHRDPVVMQ